MDSEHFFSTDLGLLTDDWKVGGFGQFKVPWQMNRSKILYPGVVYLILGDKKN